MRIKISIKKALLLFKQKRFASLGVGYDTKLIKLRRKWNNPVKNDMNTISLSEIHAYILKIDNPEDIGRHSSFGRDRKIRHSFIE